MACVTVSCIKEGTPVTGSGFKRYQFSGKVTLNGSNVSATAGQCTVRLYRLPFYKEIVAESVTDAAGNYSLDFSTSLSHTEYFLELTQPMPPTLHGYYPYFAPIAVQAGVGQKMDLVLPTYGVLQASFSKRGTDSVSSLSLQFGNLIIQLSPNSPAERHFILGGNDNSVIYCNYRVNGIQYSEPISIYVPAYDTVNQVIEYGIP